MVWLVRQTSPEVAVMTAAICSLGCFILTCLCESFRLCALGQHVSKVLTQKGLFLLMTIALGGVSIFSMNFLNLTAISVPLPATKVAPAHLAPIEFKEAPLCVSVVSSLLFAFLGLYAASHDPMFAKTKKQIVEDFIEGAKDMSLKEVKAISSFKMMYIISTQSLKHLMIGGILTGCGAAITVCLTMWSLAIPDIELVWDIGVIFADLVFACVFSFVAFWILFRLLSLYPRKEILRVASAVFMAFCFVSTHFVGIRAIRIRLKPGMAADDSPQLTGDVHIRHDTGFVVVLSSVIIFCFLLLLISVVDLRSWLYESSSVVRKHECMLMRLKALHTDNFALIAKYMREVEFERSHHSSSGSRSPKKSLLGRSITSASDAVSVMSKHLPLGRGKVTPTAGGEDVIVSVDSPSSPRSPIRPSAVVPSTVSGGPLTLRLPEEAHCQDEDVESPAGKHSD